MKAIRTMMNWCNLTSVSTPICLAVAIYLSAGATTRAGNIEYPAAGNMNLDEGTFEIWFTPQADLYPQSKNYNGILSFFAMQLPDHFTISGGFYARNGSSHVHFSMAHYQQKNALLPVPSGAVTQFKRDEVCHLALTWKDDQMYLYANGQRIGSRKQATRLTGRLGGVTFRVGNGKGRDTPYILHAVRMSSLARDESQLTDAQPQADLFTLLLDKFNTEPTNKATTAQLISGFSGETGGQLNGNWHYVSGNTPGIAMYAAKKEKPKKK